MKDVTLNIDFVKLNTIDNIKNTEIKKSKLHGFGLFATDIIKKDTVLSLLDGQKISIINYNNLVKNISNGVKDYKNYFFMEWNILNKQTYLVRPYRTKYSYINHSRNPNIILINNPLRILAIKNIEVDGELTIDYRKEDLSEEYLNRNDKQFL